MTSRFKCRNCQEDYYLSANKGFSSDYPFNLCDDTKTNRICQKCGDKLGKVYWSADLLMDADRYFEMKFAADRGERQARGKVITLDGRFIDLKLEDCNLQPCDIPVKEDLEVIFCRTYPAGRFVFASQVADYCQNHWTMSINSPPYVLYYQERRATRFAIETEIEYRLLDSREELQDFKQALENEDYDNLFEPGRTVDLSQTGAMIVSEHRSPGDVYQDQYAFLKLNYEDFSLEFSGQVARVVEIEKDRYEIAGMGIEFIEKADDFNMVMSELQPQLVTAENMF